MRLSMLNLLCICLVFIYGAITAAPAIAKQPKPDFSVESINEDHISLSFDDDKICKVYANEEAVYQYCKEITSHAFEQEIDAIIDDAIAYIPGRYNSTPAPYTPPRYVTINCPGLSLSFICE